MTLGVPFANHAARHAIRRVRHETRRRSIVVSSITAITPRMLRIVFTSPEFTDFSSAAYDDHIKLFFPLAPGETGEAARRDFTPRAFDPKAGTLTVDFALHDAGPAIEWARKAAIGQSLEIGGPRGSLIVPDDFDWYLLIGDETALPAIGRRIEELRLDVPVTSAVVVADADEIQRFETRADWTDLWAFRDAGARDDSALLRQVLARYRLPPGDGYIWIAAEASVARALRAEFTGERGHPLEWMKASGYWKRGHADAHETI